MPARPGVRWLVLGCALTLTLGCSGKSRRTGGGGDDDGPAGMAGSSGATGGTSGGGGLGGATTGGSGSGLGGSGGSSGSVAGGTSGSAAGGTSGSAAGGTSGGASGSGMGGGSGLGGAGDGGASGGGAAGASSASYPECESADDCTMVSDCCGCRAESPNRPAFCALDCVRDACAELGIASSEVACVQGRCVISRSCDGARGTCPGNPPSCPDGTIPSVLDDCWGPCLPPTECASVTNCSDCGDDFCVEFQAQRSIFSCVTRVDDCNRENYCECLGVCGECSETDDAVGCPCIVC